MKLPLAVLQEHEPEPCVGSGFCCKKAVCGEGLRVLPDDFKEGPCPQLEWDEKEERYWCGLVKNSQNEQKIRLIASLSIGAGCCMTLNDDHVRMMRKRDLPLSPLNSYLHSRDR